MNIPCTKCSDGKTRRSWRQTPRRSAEVGISAETFRHQNQSKISPRQQNAISPSHFLRAALPAPRATPHYSNPANFNPNRIHNGMVTSPTAEVPMTTRMAVGGSPP